MKILVTGATGKVGHAVARALVQRGDDVRALVRDPARAGSALPAGVETIRGDVTLPGTLPAAVAGCELVFNAMGIPEQWLPDEAIFDRVNAEGSANLVRAATGAGVRRMIHTSTNDVFHADPGATFDESTLADYPKATAYERSKQRAEKLVLAQRDGMEVVIVNPVGVYGPGPSPTVSLGENLLAPIARGRLPLLPPGGLGVVYVGGAASGHLLAAERGIDGERYILCDRHVSLHELAQTVVRVAGQGRVPLTLRASAARGLARLGETVSRVTGRPPLLAAGQLHYFLWDAHPDSTRAQRELGWEPTPLDDGIRHTLAALGL